MMYQQHLRHLLHDRCNRLGCYPQHRHHRRLRRLFHQQNLHHHYHLVYHHLIVPLLTQRQLNHHLMVFADLVHLNMCHQ